jgi:hypothetical protein
LRSMRVRAATGRAGAPDWVEREGAMLPPFMCTSSRNWNGSSAWTRNACLGPGACQRPGWVRRESAHPQS